MCRRGHAVDQAGREQAVTEKPVIAGTTQQGVVTGHAEKHVVLGTAHQHVGCVTAEQVVDASAAVEHVFSVSGVGLNVGTIGPEEGGKPL